MLSITIPIPIPQASPPQPASKSTGFVMVMLFVRCRKVTGFQLALSVANCGPWCPWCPWCPLVCFQVSVVKLCQAGQMQVQKKLRTNEKPHHP